MVDRQLRFSEHAIDRMLEWGFEVEDVEAALDTGETIEEYQDGARLVLGRAGTRPVHLVVAEDEGRSIMIVITVYEPDLELWDVTFRSRRRR